MKRLLVIVAAIVLLAALVATVRLLRQPQAASVGDAAAVPAPGDAVEVRHEFVRLPDPAAAPLLEHRSSAPAATPVSTPRLQRVRAGDDALLSKARRAILGDGRHRPEPFPRVK